MLLYDSLCFGTEDGGLDQIFVGEAAGGAASTAAARQRHPTADVTDDVQQRHRRHEQYAHFIIDCLYL